MSHLPDQIDAPISPVSRPASTQRRGLPAEAAGAHPDREGSRSEDCDPKGGDRAGEFLLGHLPLGTLVLKHSFGVT
jgi:hypothetical protein